MKYEKETNERGWEVGRSTIGDGDGQHTADCERGNRPKTLATSHQ